MYLWLNFGDPFYSLATPSLRTAALTECVRVNTPPLLFLKQAYTTYGPWAKCGPWRLLIKPSKPKIFGIQLVSLVTTFFESEKVYQLLALKYSIFIFWPAMTFVFATLFKSKNRIRESNMTNVQEIRWDVYCGFENEFALRGISRIFAHSLLLRHTILIITNS